MNKLLLSVALTLSIMLSACSGSGDGFITSTTSSDNSIPVETENTEVDNGKVNIEGLETQLSQQKNVVLTAAMYSMFYTINGMPACEDGYLSASDPLTDDHFSIFQSFAEPNVNFKCFVAWRGNYHDKSDECILARRNTKKSKVCWFNYKKYLPVSSKTKTDEGFINLINAFNYYYDVDLEKGITEKVCSKKEEITTSEREQCVKNIEFLLKKIDDGTLPNCRDKEKSAYYELLRQGKDLLEFFDNISIVNSATGYEQQGQTILFRTFTSGAVGSGFIDIIRKFGYENMCSTSGFEQDLKKANSASSKIGGSSQKTTQRQGRTVELN